MKRLCVLQVTPESPNSSHTELFKDKKECDFYFVTHDAPHKEGLKFCPNTKWADTRNILAADVPKDYEYYAFIDYDYILRPQRSLNALDQILEDLSAFEPAVLTYYPGNNLQTPYAQDKAYMESRDYSCIPFTHVGLKIVHHSLMNWFFPMTTNFSSDTDSCHMFNIQEIPFLKHVVCSHKMIYDNGFSDERADYNKHGGYTKYKMDEMWKWIRPAFKKSKLVNSYAFNEAEKRDSLTIKNAMVQLFKKRLPNPIKSPPNVDYFNLEKIEQFFDLSHEHFSNINKAVRDRYCKIDKDAEKQIESLLKKHALYEDLKTRKNPWPSIVKKINQASDVRDITTNECVEIYQKMQNNKSLFYKNCKLDEDLCKFLEGKVVAYVGPSPYLNGLSKGKEIDECDVIVRIQPEISSPEDYGSKTDIVQSCLNSNYGPPVVDHIKNNNHKIKFVICNDTASQLKHAAADPGRDDSWMNVDEVYERVFEDLDVRLVHLKNKDESWDRWALYWEVYAKEHIERIGNGYTTYSANFNSGYGAINFLLRYPLKKLKVFGVDFYNMGVPQNSKQKYNAAYIDRYGDDGQPYGPDKVLHDQLSQIMHCKNVLLKDSRFALDDIVLEKLLSEEVNSRINKFKKLPKFKNETR